MSLQSLLEGVRSSKVQLIESSQSTWNTAKGRVLALTDAIVLLAERMVEEVERCSAMGEQLESTRDELGRYGELTSDVSEQLDSVSTRVTSLESQYLDDRVSVLEEKGHPATSTASQRQRINKVTDNVKPYSGYKDQHYKRYIDFVRAVKQLCRRRNNAMTSIDIIGHLTGYALASVETWEKKHSGYSLNDLLVYLSEKFGAGLKDAAELRASFLTMNKHVSETYGEFAFRLQQVAEEWQISGHPSAPGEEAVLETFLSSIQVGASAATKSMILDMQASNPDFDLEQSIAWLEARETHKGAQRSKRAPGNRSKTPKPSWKQKQLQLEQPQADHKSADCWTCGKPGHKKAECPTKKAKSGKKDSKASKTSAPLTSTFSYDAYKFIGMMHDAGCESMESADCDEADNIEKDSHSLEATTNKVGSERPLARSRHAVVASYLSEDSSGKPHEVTGLRGPSVPRSASGGRAGRETGKKLGVAGIGLNAISEETPTNAGHSYLATIDSSAAHEDGDTEGGSARAMESDCKVSSLAPPPCSFKRIRIADGQDEPYAYIMARCGTGSERTVNELSRNVPFLIDTGALIASCVDKGVADRLSATIEPLNTTDTWARTFGGLIQPLGFIRAKITIKGRIGKRASAISLRCNLLVFPGENGLACLGHDDLARLGCEWKVGKPYARFQNMKCRVLKKAQAFAGLTVSDARQIEKVVFLLSKSVKGPPETDEELGYVRTAEGVAYAKTLLTDPDKMKDVHDIIAIARPCFRPLTMGDRFIKGVPVRKIEFQDGFQIRRQGQRPKFRRHPLESEIIQREVEKKTWIRTSEKDAHSRGITPIVNQHHFVKKDDAPGMDKTDPANWRLVVDFQVNNGVKEDVYPTLTPAEIANKHAGRRYKMQADFTNWYRQWKLSEEDKRLLRISVDGKIYQPTSQIDGLKGSAPFCQRNLYDIIWGKTRYQSMTDSYSDNVMASHKEWSDHVNMLKELFTVLAEHNVRVKPESVVIGAECVINMGVKIDDAVTPSRKLGQGITSFRSPELGSKDKQSKSLIASFLASVAYFKRHVEGFDKLAEGLRKFSLTKDLVFTQQLADAMKLLKERCTNKLVPFDRTKETRLRVDFGQSSFKEKHSVCCKLQQTNGSNAWHDVIIISRMLSEAEENSLKRAIAPSSTHGESIAALWGLETLYPYLSLLDVVNVISDNENLQYMRSSQSPLLIKMRDRIGSLYDNIRISHVSRTKNTDVDACARGATALPNTNEQVLLNTTNDVTVRQDKPTYSASEFSAKATKRMRKSKAYRLIDSSWYRIKPGGSRKQMVVPVSQHEAFIKAVHAGHMSKKEMLEASQDYWFTGIQNKISDYWKSCTTCQSALPSTRKHIVTGLRRQPNRPGQELLLDWKGPLRRVAQDGSVLTPVYHLNIMDAYTKMVDTYVYERETFDAVAEAMMMWLRRGVTPATVVFDGDSTFSSQLVAFLQKNGMKAVHSSKRLDPELIAPLERYHAEFDRFRRVTPKWYDTDRMSDWLKRWNSSMDPISGFARCETLYGLSREQSIELLHEKIRDKRKVTSVAENPFQIGDRIVVTEPASHKGELNGSGATVTAIGKASVDVKMHKDGTTRKESIRNIRKVGNLPLEESDEVTGKTELKTGSIVLYKWARRLWLGRVIAVYKSSLKITGLKATKATCRMKISERRYKEDDLDWVIKASEVVGCGTLDSEGKMKPHLQTLWQKARGDELNSLI